MSRLNCLFFFSFVISETTLDKKLIQFRSCIRLRCVACDACAREQTRRKNLLFSLQSAGLPSRLANTQKLSCKSRSRITRVFQPRLPRSGANPTEIPFVLSTSLFPSRPFPGTPRGEFAPFPSCFASNYLKMHPTSRETST